MEKNIKKRKNILIAAGVLGLIIFCIVAYFIFSGAAEEFDDSIRFYIYGHRSAALNKVVIAITYSGNWQAVTLIVLSLLISNKTRRSIGIPLAITSVSSTLIYKGVKHIFERPRPDLIYRIIEQGGFSFPSGHSMNSLVCYGMLIYLVRRHCKNENIKNAITIIFGALIPLIAISRIYVGVHYPTDILGGWCVGSFVLASAILISERIGEKNDLQ